MLINSQLVKDHFGQYYKIQTSKDKPAPLSLEAEIFRSNVQAAQFINNLQAPITFWTKIVNSETLILNSITTEKQLKEEVAELFNRGKIKAFKIDIPKPSEHPPEKRSVKDSNKNTHTFTPATSLLITNPKEVKKFSDKVQAEKYLNEFSANKEELKSIAKELNLPAAGSDSEIMSSISTSLASGSVVVVVDRYSAPPSTKSDNDEGAVRGDKDASKASSASAVVATTPTTEDDICNCTINTLTAKCKHGRTQSPKGILQVVATPDESRTEEYSLMGVKVTLKEEFSGNDIVDCSLDLQNNKGSGCFNLTNEENVIANNSTSQITVKGNSDKKLDHWPINAAPTEISIQGHGCDKAGKTVKIQHFPNQYFTVQADLDIFQSWSDGINKGWSTWAEKFFAVSPVELTPKITAPTGTFAANWGWKENASDWRAYYNISCDFGLKPIFGVEFKVMVSMVTLAGTAAGIPPNVAKLASEHIADLRLSATVGCKATLIGKPQAKFYADDTQDIEGELKFAAEGLVNIEALVRVGSVYVVSAEVSASGEAKVTAEDVASLNKSGLFLGTTVSLHPFVGTAKVKTTALIFISKTREKKWTPWKEIELYKSEDKKILPR